MAVPALLGDAPVRDVVPDEVNALSIAALNDPPLDLRQGDFVQREQRTLDRRALARIAIWCGFILFASFLIALIGIARQHMAAEQLDAESLMLARQVLPQDDDANRAEAALAARLARRGAGASELTAPPGGYLMAVQIRRAS